MFAQRPVGLNRAERRRRRQLERARGVGEQLRRGSERVTHHGNIKMVSLSSCLGCGGRLCAEALPIPLSASFSCSWRTRRCRLPRGPHPTCTINPPSPPSHQSFCPHGLGKRSHHRRADLEKMFTRKMQRQFGLISELRA